MLKLLIGVKKFFGKYLVLCKIDLFVFLVALLQTVTQANTTCLTVVINRTMSVST